jgi:hypothetical protein
MKFQFYIAGYFYGHFEVVLKNDELLFYISDYPISEDSAEPTHAVLIKDDTNWQNLIEYLTDLKWKRKYETENLDGIQWKLTFVSGIKKVNCYGSDDFPSDFVELTTLIKKITTKHKIPDRLLEIS